MEFIEIGTAEDDDSFWALAISESCKSHMRFKMGAVIIKRGRVIGFGYNRTKTHPRFGSHYQTLHAEGDAIWSCEKLGNDTIGATIIIYRKGSRNSKPCADCMKLIEKAGIKKVIYTNHE